MNFEISPDSKTLVQTSQYKGSFWVCDLSTSEVTHEIEKHKTVIMFIAFSGDGKFMMSRSKSEAIIWDTATWKDIITIEEDFGVVASTNRCCKALI